MNSEIKCRVDKDGKIFESEMSKPENFKDIRYSVRHKGNTEYLFVNNYVKGYEMKKHTNVHFNDLVGDYVSGISPFPAFDIADKDYFFYPFNMKVGDSYILTAAATPLCKLKDRKGFEDHIFLYGENERIDALYGKRTRIITLEKSDALNANKVPLDRDYLFITDGHIIMDGDEMLLYTLHDTDDDIIVYPKNDNLKLNGYVADKVKSPDYSIYRTDYSKRNLVDIIDISQIAEKVRNAGYFNSKDVKTIDMRVSLDYDMVTECDRVLDNIYLKISYKGDMLQIIIDGEIVNDNFNNNDPFTVGLKEYGYPKELVIRIYGLDEDNDKYFEKPIEFTDGFACELSGIETKTNYKKVILYNHF